MLKPVPYDVAIATAIAIRGSHIKLIRTKVLYKRTALHPRAVSILYPYLQLPVLFLQHLANTRCGKRDKPTANQPSFTLQSKKPYKMPVPMPAFPNKDEKQRELYGQPTEAGGVRDIGSAGAASAEALATRPSDGHARLPGAGSGGTVSAPGYSAAENGDLLENAETNVQISKEDAERMYQERIEEEYAKREGGA